LMALQPAPPHPITFILAPVGTKLVLAIASLLYSI
jgi:hypothetical protein